eukprot:SAG22_NODE_49_length_24620_cov_80.053587_19_plen_95_part_00
MSSSKLHGDVQWLCQLELVELGLNSAELNPQPGALYFEPPQAVDGRPWCLDELLRQALAPPLASSLKRLDISHVQDDRAGCGCLLAELPEERLR